MRYHTESLPLNSDTRPPVILLELELRLQPPPPPRQQLHLSLHLTFITDKRLQPVSSFQFELLTTDGSGDGGGGGSIVRNFSFSLVSSLRLVRFGSIPPPITVEPLVRWGLRPCTRIDQGE